MKRCCSILLLFLFASFVSAQEKETDQRTTQVIAHRGYWNIKGVAQNSVAALEKAQRIGIYGSEFDVLVTADDLPVINHDPTIQGLPIEDTPYDQLKGLRLSNEEKLPTLKDYLKQGKKDPFTRLVLEIKGHSTAEKESQAAEAILQMVRKAKSEEQVEYISFSWHICLTLRQLDADARIFYLSGDKTPQEVKAAGLTGMDYHYDVYRKNREWVTQARELGLETNVWTVNNINIMKEMVDMGVDYLTTDKPYVAQQMIKLWSTYN